MGNAFINIEISDGLKVSEIRENVKKIERKIKCHCFLSLFNVIKRKQKRLGFDDSKVRWPQSSSLLESFDSDARRWRENPEMRKFFVLKKSNKCHLETMMTAQRLHTMVNQKQPEVLKN